jgi:hypothetical protein
MTQAQIGWLMVTTFATIYFAPWLLAIWLNRRQAPAIFALNLCLGWTVIGWVGALVWALVRPVQPTRS